MWALCAREKHTVPIVAPMVAQQSGWACLYTSEMYGGFENQTHLQDGKKARGRQGA